MGRQERLNEIRRIRDRRSRDWFFDKWEGDFEMGDFNFDREEKAFFSVFIVLWAVAALASLAVTGVLIWAIIELVQWATAK